MTRINWALETRFHVRSNDGEDFWITVDVTEDLKADVISPESSLGNFLLHARKGQRHTLYLSSGETLVYTLVEVQAKDPPRLGPELYRNHCWRCGALIRSNANRRCTKCGMFVCSKCGACMCKYTGKK